MHVITIRHEEDTGDWIGAVLGDDRDPIASVALAHPKGEDATLEDLLDDFGLVLKPWPAEATGRDRCRWENAGLRRWRWTPHPDHGDPLRGLI